jgi:hypothetical protein
VGSRCSTTSTATAVDVPVKSAPTALFAMGHDEGGAFGVHLARAIDAAYNCALITWGLVGDGSPAEHVRDELTCSSADTSHPRTRA